MLARVMQPSIHKVRALNKKNVQPLPESSEHEVLFRHLVRLQLDLRSSEHECIQLAKGSELKSQV